jgi:predicted ATPase/DNA-binding SARP family transcriptional activator
MIPTLRVLGPLEIVGPAGLIAIREGLPRKLIAALAIRMPSPVSVDALVEELWTSKRPADARNALQAQVSYVRRRLEPVQAQLMVERYADGYRLICTDESAFDATVFERAIRAIESDTDAQRAADHQARIRGADDALSMWRGHPYADAMYDDFAQAEINRLRELHATVNERRAESLLALGRHADAAASLQNLVAEYPLRESLWAAYMLALYRSRRQAEALRAYSTARERLIEDLGVEPCAALRDLEARILAQDPSLDPAAESPATFAVVGLTDKANDRLPLAKPVFDSRVPEPLSSLVGRGFEVEQISNLVHSGRLTTLTGVGGVGKTRLAIEIALAVKHDWPTRLIEFGSLAAGADVNLLIASEIGVPSVPNTNPLEAVAAQLGQQPSLLVFDTCEHVIDQVALAAATLLRRNEHVRILATSRQPLGVAGEVVWSVPPLELAEEGATSLVEVAASGAVRLFEARARASRTDFMLDADNAGAVAHICRSLDGLPLAIELAAARVNLLSPAKIVERLDDRFAFLSHGPRTVESRQRSLRALIQWSYDMLAEDERTFFDRLGVFGDSFDLNAAAAVAGEGLDTDPLELLGALVERSLVASTRTDRFVLLDILREFAASRLEDGSGAVDASAIRQRHAQWYTRLALDADPKSHGPLPAAWPTVRAETSNCLSALAWYSSVGDLVSGARLAGALAGFWMLEEQIVQADRWLNRFRMADADDATMASLMRGVGILELYQSRFDDALEATRQSVAHARASGDQHLVASALLAFGSAHWGVGNFTESESALAEAADIFEAVGDQRGHGFALALLGRTRTASGDPTAVSCLEQAMELLAASGDGWMGCAAAEHLATAMLRSGRVDEAAQLARASIALGERVGSRAGQVAALLTLGRALLAAGETTQACRTHTAVLARALASGNPGTAADAIDALADVIDHHDQPDLAVQFLGSASAIRARRNVLVPSVARDGRLALTGRLSARVGDNRYAELEGEGRRRDAAWVRDQVEAVVGANV